MKPIVVVGSVNMDVVSHAETIPAPGETVMGSSFKLNHGGKGANQAVAVARLGHPSIFLGKVGGDVFGHQLKEGLARHGVHTDEMETVEGESGTASIVVDAHGENSIVVTPAANRYVSPEYVSQKRHIIKEAGVVLAQLEIPAETVLRLAELCEELNVPLLLDPAPAQSLSTDVLSRTTWFTPNQTEAQFYGGNGRSAEHTLSNLFALGISNVILKQGGEGALMADARGTRHAVDAFPVKAVDTTAAGDAFNGAFAVAVMSGRDAMESLRYASAAAAISVTRSGAQASMATAAEVNAFLATSTV